MRITALAAVAALLLPGAGRAEGLRVSDAFSRASSGDRPGVAYMTIHGGDTADRLVSAQSPRAARVELHTMTMDGGVMRMRPVEGIDVPAGGTVRLAPGQPFHLMLEGLKEPLRQGEMVPLALRFERAGERRVDVAVGGPGASEPPGAKGKAR